MLELVVVMMTFFGTLFMSIEMGRVGFELMALNHTVKTAAHWGSLGVVDANSNRIDTIQRRARQIWSDKGLNPDRLTIVIRTLSADPTSETITSDAVGRRGDYLIVEGTVSANLGSFLGMLDGTGHTRTIELRARGVTRNE